jgi:GMP synthase-like glutamine amidotransferase
MRIHSLQHVPFEGLANIESWASRSGHTATASRLFSGDRLPDLEDFELLVILGGPMGANDELKFRWMKGEKLFIESAIRKGKKVLGICLGAQLIAAALGAKVYPNAQKEIGWYPLELDPQNIRHSPLNVLPPHAMVFHWHGDTFDLPPGALHLARSRACENQAFSVGENVIGLQFHLELAMPHIETLLRHAASDMTPGDFVMGGEEILDLAPSQGPPLNAALYRLLDSFTA